MKIKGRVLKVVNDTVIIQMTKLPKEGTVVNISWGKIRSIKQNNLYWQFLTWLIEEGGMKEQGYMFPEELHESLKGRLLSTIVTSKAGFDTRVIKSTTDLTADEFLSYIEKCEHLLKEYCGVSAREFWTEYANNYAGGE